MSEEGNPRTETVFSDGERSADRQSGHQSGAATLGRASLVGRYLLLEPIGEGGMGRVFSAYDPELDRRVAIKVLHSAPDRAVDQHRLQQEARTAARLTHPNVVTIYDVGLFEGRVFVAMELLDGAPLSGWIAEGEHDYRETVGLFIQAGRGLAAAHQAGLIHHDFKPSNAVLGSDGRVRLVDFGVSQIVGRPADGSGTSGAGRPSPPVGGTAAYAAPERRAGRPLDIRSDQYSFCASLHQALFGELPSPGTGLPDTRSGNPLPKRLRAALARGLDADPDDRFPSMDALLGELEAGLRPRRWPLPVAALTVAGALGLTLWVGGARQPPCTDAAQRLTGVWDDGARAALHAALSATGSPLAEPAAAAIQRQLDNYAQGWSEMYTEACRATHVSATQSESLLDLRMACLQRRLDRLGAVADGLTRVEAQGLSQALEVAAGLDPLGECADSEALLSEVPLPADAEQRAEVERIHRELAALRTAHELRQPVDTTAAETLTATAGELGYPPLEAEAHWVLASLREEYEAEYQRAASSYEDSLAAALAGRSRRLAARALIGLASASDHDPDSVRHTRMWGRLAAGALDGLGPDGHPDLAASLHNVLGINAWSRGDTDLAREHFERSLAAGRSAFGDRSPRLRSALTNLGGLTVDNPSEAIPFLELALEVEEEAFGEETWTLAPPLVNLSSTYAELQRYDEALAACRRAHAVLLPVHGADHPYLAYPKLQEGLILVAQEDSAAAVSVLSPLVGSIERGFGAEDPLLAQALQGLADARRLGGETGEPERLLLRARQILRRQPAEHPLQAEVATSLGLVRLAQQRPGEARRLFEAARSALGASGKSGRRSALRAAWGLAESFLAAGRPDRAAAVLEDTLPDLHHPDPRLHGAALFTLARAVHPAEPERALELAARARDELAGLGGPSGERRRMIEAWLNEVTPR